MKSVLLVILLATIGYGQISKTSHGGGLNIGEQGAGIFYHGSIKHYKNFNIGADLRWYDVRPTADSPLYDPYTGRFLTRNSVSLVLFPLFGTLNYYPFEGKIANNFSPFICTKIGPVLVLDGDEETEKFLERWSSPKSSFSYGGNVGIGVEFRNPGRINYNIELSYDYLPLGKTIDTYDSVNGIILSFSIHR